MLTLYLPGFVNKNLVSKAQRAYTHPKVSIHPFIKII